jgi:hypothetical protein
LGDLAPNISEPRNLTNIHAWFWCCLSLSGLYFLSPQPFSLLGYGIGSRGSAIPFEYFHVETRSTAETENKCKGLERGRSSVVGIMTRKSRVHIPVGVKRLFCKDGMGATQRPVQWILGSFLKIKRLGLEANHSPPSSATVKNKLSYSSSPPCLRTAKNLSFVKEVGRTASSHSSVHPLPVHPLVRSLTYPSITHPLLEPSPVLCALGLVGMQCKKHRNGPVCCKPTNQHRKSSLTFEVLHAPRNAAESAVTSIPPHCELHDPPLFVFGKCCVRSSLVSTSDNGTSVTSTLQQLWGLNPIYCP